MSSRSIFRLQSRYYWRSQVVLKSDSLSSSQSCKYSTTTKTEENEALWVTSPRPPVSAVTGYTIPEYFRENLGDWGRLPAYECATTGKVLTHNQIFRYSQGFAAALIKSGFQRGDVVAIVLPNIPEFAAVLFGIWEAGLIASPVNAGYSDEEVKRQLQHSNAVCVVAEEATTLPTVLKAKQGNPQIRSVVVVGEPHEGCHTFKEMANCDTFGINFLRGRDIDTLNEVCLLPFSSGTTGPPKGVELTHSNLVSNMAQGDPSKGMSLIKRHTPDTGQERFVGVLPFYHAFGLASLVNRTMNIGAHVMCFRKFSPPVFLEAVRRHKPTAFHLVTPLISYMVNDPNYGAKELEHAHSIMGGAAPIGASLIERMLEKSGKYLFFQEGYGMSETTAASHGILPEFRNTKVGSCGSPIPGTLTKLIDPAGKTLGRNERGEVCIKGPQVMKGYFKNEEATRNTIDTNGWLHTGDIAYYDDDGCMYIVDRIKELIKVKGFQVAPSELEDLLRKHEKVQDVAVIGVPHLQNGEAPRAYIVTKGGTTLLDEEIHAYMKPLVSKHKWLEGGVEMRTSIPKAPSGKILRRELLEEYRAKQHSVKSVK